MLTPRAKEVHQLYFDHQADHNKRVARNRVFIEVICGNCRPFNAFSKVINLDAIDIADLEAQAVCCEVNLWPVMHDCTLTAELASGMQPVEPAIVAARQSMMAQRMMANEAGETERAEQKKKREADRTKKAEEMARKARDTAVELDKRASEAASSMDTAPDDPMAELLHTEPPAVTATRSVGVPEQPDHGTAQPAAKQAESTPRRRGSARKAKRGEREEGNTAGVGSARDGKGAT